MNLPSLPDSDGEDWRDFLSCPTGRNGWRAIHLWGSWGWRLGRWPSKVVCHYDGDGSYGHAVLSGGVFTVKEFLSRDLRDDATDRYFVQFNGAHQVEGGDAPVHMWDGRLGPPED